MAPSPPLKRFSAPEPDLSSNLAAQPGPAQQLYGNPKLTDGTFPPLKRSAAPEPDVSSNLAAQPDPAQQLSSQHQSPICQAT